MTDDRHTSGHNNLTSLHTSLQVAPVTASQGKAQIINVSMQVSVCEQQEMCDR
jgi:hypothetical protein